MKKVILASVLSVFMFTAVVNAQEKPKTEPAKKEKACCKKDKKKEDCSKDKKSCCSAKKTDTKS